ncbi:MAG: carbohydrate ABC transporter substrate-binding protein [Proteobacteria bacterium]|nr:carbohydrate ABC transporter substrate-binding protein [Pseudomonadota bacterium]
MTVYVGVRLIQSSLAGRCRLSVPCKAPPAPKSRHGGRVVEIKNRRLILSALASATGAAALAACGGDAAPAAKAEPTKAAAPAAAAPTTAPAAAAATKAPEPTKAAAPAAAPDAAASGGKQYSVPVNIHRSNVMWFNKKIMADNGITAAPATFDEWFAMAEKLKAKGIPALAMGASSAGPDAHLFENILAGVVEEGPEPRCFHRMAQGLRQCRRPGRLQPGQGFHPGPYRRRQDLRLRRVPEVRNEGLDDRQDRPIPRARLRGQAELGHRLAERRQLLRIQARCQGDPGRARQDCQGRLGLIGWPGQSVRPHVHRGGSPSPDLSGHHAAVGAIRCWRRFCSM